MERARGFSSAHYYLRMHLWLHYRRDRLTAGQHKLIVLSLSSAYFACSIWMMVQFFLSREGKRLPIPKGMIINSNIHTGSVFTQLYQRYLTNSNENGQ